MCAHAGLTQKPLADLTPHLAEGEWGIRELSDAVSGCPACILATIRQSGINDNCAPEETLWYDFRAAMKEWYDRQDSVVSHDSLCV